MTKQPLLRALAMLPDPVAIRLGGWLRGDSRGATIMRPLVQRLRENEAVIVRGPAAGLRVHARHGSLRVALGRTEPTVQQTCANLLHPGATFFDIGANIGLYTLIAARIVGPAGHVVAFEPVPEFAGELEQNILMNHFGNVELRRVGVGSAPGRASIGRTEVETEAHLDSPRDGDRDLVTVVTIDDQVRHGLPAPDVVKIDVEGAELDVVAGMTETLRTSRPTLLCEMHGLNRQFADCLRPFDYLLTAVESALPVDEAPWWVHVVAVPAERATA